MKYGRVSKSILKRRDQIVDELIRVLRTDGSLCWQVGNYLDKSEVFPLDVFYYNIFKKHGLKLLIGLFGTLNMVCMLQKDFREGIKQYFHFTKS